MRIRLHFLVRTGCDLFGRFRHDQSGNYLIMSAVLMPALAGMVGLGTDYGLWTYGHQTMQSAADSAAVSAAWAYTSGSSNSAVTMQANAVTSSYGFVNGANSVTVTVNRPPQSGSYTSNSGAVEVIISQPQTPIFSALFLSNQLTISARAVALGNKPGDGCVLSLDGTASGAITVSGTANVSLNKCSVYDNSNSSSALTINGGGKITAKSVNVVGGVPNLTGITTTDGILQDTGSPMTDPYATVANPSPTGSLTSSCCSSGTLNPGIYKGMKLNSGSNVTLNPGTYYIECPCTGGSGGLDVAGGATLTGTGVTLVFTSSDGSKWATSTINGGASVNLTAPTTGATAGIVVF